MTGPTLNPNLESFWRTRARNRVLYGGRSSSKCLAVGTRVIMADYSLRRIEDVRVGEQVMGPDGSPRDVLDTTRGVGEMYRIHQRAGGDDYVVNGDHILSLKKRPGRYPNGPEIVNIPVREYLSKSNKWRDYHRGYKSGCVQFPPAGPLPVDPYFLGLWLGDGTYRELAVTSMDPEVLAYLAEFAIANGLGLRITQKPGQQAYTISLPKQSGRYNPVWQKLVSLGVAENRVKRAPKAPSRKRIPACYLTASESDRLRLLAGLVDSDGHYHAERRSMIVSQVRDDLADDIYRLVNSLGFRSSIITRGTTCRSYRGETHVITISGDLCRIPTLLPRKQAPETTGCRDYLCSTLDVTPAGVGEYAGFTLSGDSLFLLADHTVTHNSWDAAGFAIFLAQRCRIRFLCTRQIQNRIDQSVYTLLKYQIERFGLRDQFRITDNKIVHSYTGTEFMFYGLWRHVDEIKSLHDVDIHWAEEAHGLTEEQWRIIDPTLRAEGSQHWIIFNPNLVTDFVWQRFIVNPPPQTVIRQINYDENPFLSKTIRDVIMACKAEDEEEYRHVYLGEPLQDDDQVIIKRSWIVASIDAHKRLGIEPMGLKRVGYDVADDGPDCNATITAHGFLATAADQWKGGTDELLKSCARVFKAAQLAGCERIYYDNIGVGAFAGGKFNELNRGVRPPERILHKGFGAGEKIVKPDRIYQAGVRNRDFFANLKAQAWWGVADRFRNTYVAINQGRTFPADELIAIDSSLDDLEQLINELSTPRKDYDACGRVKVESKKDLSKRGIESPNLADAFITAYNPLIASAVDYGKLL